MNSVQIKIPTFDRELKEGRDYWVARLLRGVGGSNISLDYDRAAAGSEVNDIETKLPDALTAKLVELTGDSPFLVYAVLVAVLKICLHQYTGSSAVTVGSPCRRRNGGPPPQANALAMMDEIDSQMSVREFLFAVRATLVEGYTRQNYPFARLVKDLGLEKQENKCPLFDVALVLENIHGELPEVRNDITLIFVKDEHGIAVRVEYRSQLFKRESIERLMGHFEQLLESVVSNPEQRLSELQMLGEQEREQILVEWNSTAAEYPGQCIQELFEAQVERTPEAVALVFGEEEVSYAKLNSRANQLAHYLRRQGVGPEEAVGVVMERSVELVVSMLGILKAGGAYVPLDPEYPQDRLSFMIEDAGLRVVLTTAATGARLPDSSAQEICVERDWPLIAQQSLDNPPVQTQPEDLAYVIYTSGSTGIPKGVSVPHRAVIRLVFNTNFVELDSTARIALVSNAAFDALTFELWGALLHGGQLIGVSKELALSPPEFAREIARRGINVLFLTTALFNQMVRSEPQAFASLRYLLFGGEAVDPQWVREVLEKGAPEQLLHVYGPTENTTFSTWYRVESVAADAATVPIGAPVMNTQVYLLDQQMRPVPVGVEGELYVGGAGLARDYWRRPELTAERFVPHPYSAEPGARLYRTGDLVRWSGEGQLEFLGRRDQQVKLRGYRIELGEVEAALLSLEQVREAVVVAREDGGSERRLVGYMVCKDGATPSSRELREELLGLLPGYMVPGQYVKLERMPLTASGKIDRRALPAPDGSRPADSDSYVAARTPVEEILAGIWSQLLQVEQVGVDDDFFALGGHSLLATQLVSRVRNIFQVEVGLRQLFEQPTIAGVVREIERLKMVGEDLPALPLGPVSRAETISLSYAQQRLWFLDQLEPGSCIYNIPTGVRLRGIVEIKALEQSFSEVIRRHESLRTRFGVVNGVPVQVIDEAAEFNLTVLDLSGVVEAEREAETRRVATEEARRPFNLSSGPLLRAMVVRLGEQEHVLLCTMHHIISDGWSMGVLIRELTTLYEAYATGQQSPLPELEIQYADFAHWQREWLQGEVLERQLGYWTDQLAGAPALLELPTDYPRPAVQSFSGATQFFVLPAVLREQLEDLSRRTGTTLYMTLLAAFQTLLSRYSRQDDVVVGSPIANRNRAETESLIGFFVNTLVFRTDLSGDPSFRELLGRVREVALGGYAHQDVPFELVVEALQPERSLGHTPLFQVVFTLQNAPMVRTELTKLEVSGLAMETSTAKFDLGLNIGGTEGDLQGAMEYNTDLFDAATIRRMLSHFEVLLENVVRNPEERLSELQLLREEERDRVLVDWNDTAVEYPQEKCIHQLFEEQVERTPEAVAVLFEDQQVTYRALNERANRLAHYLQSSGVGPETLVGICVERSVEMVVGLLGILKAGGAYVPIDARYPPEWQAKMLEQGPVTVLVTQGGQLESMPAYRGQVVCVEEESEEAWGGGRIATLRAE